MPSPRRTSTAGVASSRWRPPAAMRRTASSRASPAGTRSAGSRRAPPPRSAHTDPSGLRNTSVTSGSVTTDARGPKTARSGIRRGFRSMVMHRAWRAAPPHGPPPPYSVDNRHPPPLWRTTDASAPQRRAPRMTAAPSTQTRAARVADHRDAVGTAAVPRRRRGGAQLGGELGAATAVPRLGGIGGALRNPRGYARCPRVYCTTRRLQRKISPCDDCRHPSVRRRERHRSTTTSARAGNGICGVARIGAFTGEFPRDSRHGRESTQG